MEHPDMCQLQNLLVCQYSPPQNRHYILGKSSIFRSTKGPGSIPKLGLKPSDLGSVHSPKILDFQGSPQWSSISRVTIYDSCNEDPLAPLLHSPSPHSRAWKVRFHGPNWRPQRNYQVIHKFDHP